MPQALLHKLALCIRYFLCGTFVFTALFLHAQETKPTIEVKIKAQKANGTYTSNDNRRIGYIIKLRNTINDYQNGTISIAVKNSVGLSIYNDAFGISMAPKSAFFKNYFFDNAKFKPGFYFISIHINTNQFSQLYNYAFTVDAEKIPAFSYKPDDFSNFWDNAKNELVNINPQYQVTRRGDLSTESVDVFLVEFISLKNNKIRGWLTVPKNRSKSAVLYKLPSYASPAKPELRSDMAVFSLDARGIGGSADNLQLNYDNYLTTGIANKYSCIYRDVYMDCLRGLDFIVTNQELKLDITKIIVKGDGQGAALAAIVAGLDGKNIKGLIMERPVFLDMRSIFSIGEIQQNMPWPLSTLKNYLRNSKTPIDNFFKTWDYFDAINFATLVKCPVLMGTSLKGTISPPQCAYNFYNQILGTNREIFVCPDNENNMDAPYYVLENSWIKETLRIPN